MAAIHSQIVINEIAPGYGEKSFVELYFSSGIPAGSTLHYGLIVLTIQSDVVRIKAVFDIPRDEFVTDPFYYILGSPPDHWVEDKPSYKGTPITAGYGVRRIYGNPYEWLNVLDDTYKIVILTEADYSISIEWPNIGTFGRNEKPIEEYKKFKSYVIQHQIDAVMMKDRNVILPYAAIEDFFLLDMDPKYIIPPFGDVLKAEISLSRCEMEGEAALVPFQMSLFKGCKVSPGSPNNCYDQVNYLEGLQTDTVPEQPADSMETNEEDANDMEVDNLVEGPSLGECNPEEDYEQPDENAAHQLEQLVLDEERQSPTPTNENDGIAFAEKEKMDKVVEHMFVMKQFLPNIINENTVIRKYWKWYNQDFNEDDPDSSTFNCGPCSTHIGDHPRSKLASVNGVKFKAVKSSNMKTMAKHDSSYFHGRAMLADAIEMAKILDPIHADTLIENDKRENIVTLNHIQQVYYAARKFDSFESHDASIENLIAMNVPMGEGCRGKQSARRIALVINEVFKAAFLQMLKRTNGPIFLIVDGSEGLLV